MQLTTQLNAPHKKGNNFFEQLVSCSTRYAASLTSAFSLGRGLKLDQVLVDSKRNIRTCAEHGVDPNQNLLGSKRKIRNHCPTAASSTPIPVSLGELCCCAATALQ